MVDVLDADDAHFTVFQCDRIGDMPVFQQAVHAEDFSRKKKPSNLHVPRGVFELRLQGPEPYPIYRIGRIVQAEQRGALAYADALLHKLIQLFHLIRRHAYRQADITEHAGGAACGFRCDGYCSLHSIAPQAHDGIAAGRPCKREQLAPSEGADSSWKANLREGLACTENSIKYGIFAPGGVGPGKAFDSRLVQAQGLEIRGYCPHITHIRA